MIDIGSETLVPLTQVARNFPAPESRRGIDVRVLHRWARKGVMGVRLDVVRRDGIVCTSYEALGRFVDLLVARAEQGGDVQPLRCHSDVVRGFLARVGRDTRPRIIRRLPRRSESEAGPHESQGVVERPPPERTGGDARPAPTPEGTSATQGSD